MRVDLKLQERVSLGLVITVTLLPKIINNMSKYQLVDVFIFLKCQGLVLDDFPKFLIKYLTKFYLENPYLKKNILLLTGI